MNKPPTSFRYINDLNFTCVTDITERCIICDQIRIAYWWYTLDEAGYQDYFVCESCLVSGKLAVTDWSVNDADISALTHQLRVLYPERTEQERRALTLERTTQVERCTPRPVIPQPFQWPAHCGDYLVFFRRVFVEDLNELALNGDGRSFFAAHIHEHCAQYYDGDSILQEWENNLKGFGRFYLWQCRECQEYQLTCDSD